MSMQFILIEASQWKWKCICIINNRTFQSATFYLRYQAIFMLFSQLLQFLLLILFNILTIFLNKFNLQSAKLPMEIFVTQDFFLYSH